MSNYKRWNIIDLFDYLKNFYFDNAQENPQEYAAKYDGPDPNAKDKNGNDIYTPSTNPTKQEVIDFRNKYAIEYIVDPETTIWFWRDNVKDELGNYSYYVSKFKDLIYIWRSKELRLTEPRGEFSKHFIDPPRNNYVISAGAWENILKERYAEYQFLTSFDYDYTTEKRTHCKTISEACAKLWKTIDVYKHDKQDPLTKLLDALRSEYDPISNYDKHSDITKEYVGSETDVTKPEGSETNTFKKGTETTTNKVTSFDSGNSEWLNKAKNETDTYTDKNSITYGVDEEGVANARKDTHHKRYGYMPDGTTQDERKDIVHEITKGNIGVTTSQQMIMSQFEVERFDRIEHYVVSDFVHTTLVR